MGLSQDQKDDLLKKMRDRQNKADSGSSRDPLEWRPPKVDKDDPDKIFKVIFLPPVEAGQMTVDGPAEESMVAWFQPHGHHWINNRRYPCPRAMETKSDCPLCSTGFDLMKETDDKEVKKSIAKEWLSQQMHAVNIYFLKHKDNPEELHGKTMWWSLPVAVYNVCKTTLNSNDAGDEDEPKANGLFFLPEECFAFNVTIKHKSGYNNYESSAFLGKPRALCATDEEEKLILAARTDLTKKFEKPDLAQLNKLLDEKANGGSSSPAKTETKATSKSNDDDDAPPPRAKTTTESKPVSETKVKVDEDDAPPPRPKTTEVKAEKPAETKAEETPATESDPDIDDLLKQLS